MSHVIISIKAPKDLEEFYHKSLDKIKNDSEEDKKEFEKKVKDAIKQFTKRLQTLPVAQIYTNGKRKKHNYVDNKKFLEEMINYRNSVLQAHDFGAERPRVPYYTRLYHEDCYTFII